MRAFVITGPRQTAVEDVARPAAAPGQAVIDVELAGVCGTDVEFFTGEMAYLHQGHAKYPVRPGHEWCGTVAAVGILGGSHALAGAIEQYAAGKVYPRPLVAATVGLGDVGSVLAGTRPPGSGPGPKILIDPRR